MRVRRRVPSRTGGYSTRKECAGARKGWWTWVVRGSREWGIGSRGLIRREGKVRREVPTPYSPLPTPSALAGFRLAQHRHHLALVFLGLAPFFFCDALFGRRHGV